MNLFKLSAVLGLDTSEYERNSENAVAHGKSLAGRIGSALSTTVKAVSKGIAVAAGGVATLTGMAVREYAEYEQLVGGVETLFGASADKLKSYAAQAYQTAGMSANEYMEQATSFSASLVQSLGGDTEAAANMADMAIKDMSDNANKMGTDIEMIKNAYQGFAKGNFTMLDNLKLGYGGTKTEMERLLRRAEEIEGYMEGSMSTENFADIIEAINIIQEDLGIMGTTKDEAFGTISGSIASVKAAFSNLLVGISDDSADFGQLMTNFVDSAAVAADNLIPRFQTTLEGIGQLIEKLFPVIMDRLPQIISETLPKLIKSGLSIIQSFAKGIKDNLPLIVETTLEVVGMLLTTLVNSIPDIIAMGTDLLVSLIDGIAAHPDEVIETAIELVVNLVTGLVEAIPKLIEAAGRLIAELVSSLISHFPEILQTGKDILDKICEGIANAFGKIVEAGANIVGGIIDGIAGAWNGLVDWFSNLWDNLFGGRSVNVNVNRYDNYLGHGYGYNYDGSHANGLSYVPWDGYIAQLHQGETVLTRKEANELRKGRNGTVIEHVDIHIDGAQEDPATLAEIIAEQLQEITERRSAVYGY